MPSWNFVACWTGLVIRQCLAKANPTNAQWRRDLEISISKIGDVAYKLVLARDFTAALAAADQAIALSSGEVWLHTNRAHALMFLGRTDEARMLYLQYRGEKNVDGDKSWEALILEDIAELRKAGLAHPLMEEIADLFASRR